MSVERIDELADSVLDGEASAEERAELERLLAENPEAKARVAERRALFETLRGVPRRSPPEDLRDSILTAIRIEGSGAHRSGPHGGRHPLLARHPSLALGYALVAGLVIGSITTLAVRGNMVRKPGDGTPIAGTMAPPGSAGGTVIHGSSFALRGADYRAETRWNDRGIVLLLSGRSSKPIDFTIEYKPEELRLSSILPPASADLGVEHSKGRLQIRGSGEMSLELSWLPLVPAPRALGIVGRIEDKEETMILAVSPRTRDSPRGP